MTTIWVVEDDATIRVGLVRAFQADGFDVLSSATAKGVAGLAGSPDLVLLDVNLPDGDGFDVCRELVARFPAVRVMMLTARMQEIDVVVGLDSGAVDYVTKPFRLAELKARVRAQLRVPMIATTVASDEVLEVGDVRLDAASRRVWLDGTELVLRHKEFDLLARLMRQPGRVIRREDLMSDVWDEHWSGSTKTLDVHIAALRRRFGEAPDTVSRITTIRGVGFRLELAS